MSLPISPISAAVSVLSTIAGMFDSAPKKSGALESAGQANAAFAAPVQQGIQLSSDALAGGASGAGAVSGATDGASSGSSTAKTARNGQDKGAAFYEYLQSPGQI